MADAVTNVRVVRVQGRRLTHDSDRTATEEPLEVRIHGRPFAVIMRTPGADRELAAGFLLAERVIRSADDLGTIAHCVDSDTESPNVINVTLTDGLTPSIESALADARRVTTNSSCGLCGRLTIDSLKSDVPPLSGTLALPAPTVLDLPLRLRRSQTLFEETGGLHAAGLFDARGNLEAVAEDVGRHNAVDKVVGRALMAEQLPLARHLLFVSGRTSFEIIQKALFAGIPLVGSVSAPSSLAVALADDVGITLVGFVRDDGFNIYTHPEQIV